MIYRLQGNSLDTGGDPMRRDAIAQTLLLDYYGELLTQKQRLYCDLYYNQDYSLAEIAEETGISRQGVHDSLLHAGAALQEFERILGCAARDLRLRQRAGEAARTLSPLLSHPDAAVREAAQKAAELITTIQADAGASAEE